ncbi:MAG: AbgT family transporter, partial [Clostridia bacterium]|nr:AbgT family transporter [Clostridia bacterium]
RFELDENGSIITGTYQKGAVKGIAFWRVLTAPFRVFFSSDGLTIVMICLFLLVMSGVFNILDKTNGIKIFMKKLMAKFSTKKIAVVIIFVLMFMLFGSFFGMYEELVTLLPLVVVFMLSLGFDTMTGLGVCLMSACFGFSAAITNPFSVGLASEMSGVDILDGVWLRIIFFFIIFAIISVFLVIHIKRITKDPKKSLTYEMDKPKKSALLSEDTSLSDSDKKVFKVYAVFFAVQLVVLVLIATIRALSSLAIPILAVTFLLGGIVSGLLVCKMKGDVFKHLGNGMLSMFPAVALIAIASSVKLVMSESGIIDTIMNYVIVALDGQSKFVCILLIYFLILFLQIFIGSASAKIMLIIPIIMPICKALGISPSTVILTYCIADGFTDVIIPTNPILLISLSMMGVSYGKWVKWTWLVQIIIFVLTVLILLFAVTIGY